MRQQRPTSQAPIERGRARSQRSSPITLGVAWPPGLSFCLRPVRWMALSGMSVLRAQLDVLAGGDTSGVDPDQANLAR